MLQQGYTPDGLVGSLTDANGNVTDFAYDGFDRLGTTTYPDASTEVLAYDADGNMTARTTRAGQALSFVYDTLNRLMTKTVPSEPTVSYSYDLDGRLTGVSDDSAAIASVSGPAASYTASYSYDALNRPITVSWTPAPTPVAPAAASVTFTHGYNAASQRVSQAATDNSWWYYPPATPGSVGLLSRGVLWTWSLATCINPPECIYVIDPRRAIEAAIDLRGSVRPNVEFTAACGIGDIRKNRASRR